MLRVKHNGCLLTSLLGKVLIHGNTGISRRYARMHSIHNYYHAHLIIKTKSSYPIIPNRLHMFSRVWAAITWKQKFLFFIVLHF